jgi:hypothetical protein
MSRTPVEQEHINTLTTRYLYLKRVLKEAGGTKKQRKEFEALIWALKNLIKKMIHLLDN